MGDVLTQIQDELDKLLLQMVSGLQTIKFRAPPIAPPGQPLLPTFAEFEAQQATSQQQQQAHSNANAGQGQPQTANQDVAQPPALQTVSSEELHSQIKELSYDLIQKEQQLEILIKALPGIGTSEKAQEDRMRDLERQLEEIEGERGAAVRERDELLQKVEKAILGVGVC